MQILNLKNEVIPPNSVSLFEEISNNNEIGYVIRNFLSPEEISTLLASYKEYTHYKYNIFPGFTMLPRSFEYVLNAKEGEYEQEIEHMESNAKLLHIKNTIEQKFKEISKNSKFDFSSKNNSFSHSKGWSSYRELAPNNSFEIHCGNVFRYFSADFFEHQYKAMEKSHFSFFIMVNKPLNDTDIIIYEPHYNQLPEKVSPTSFKDKNGDVIEINDIKRYNVNLNIGDLLLFDESNYWHEVPAVEGVKNRITFGGFISKFIEEKKYLVWT